MHKKLMVQIPEGKDYLQDLVINGWIMSKRILKNKD